MITAFVRGARYPLIGLSWLGRPRLRSYVIVPLLINILVFGGLIWWGAGTFATWVDSLSATLTAWLPDWLDWLVTALYWLLWPLFVISILLVAFYTFALVANLIASPFNGMLAERVEDMADPNNTRPPGRALAQEIVRAPVLELKKIGYFLLRAIPLLILFLIPVVNILAPFIWMVFSAWMLALQYGDYPMDNHRIEFREQRRRWAEKRMLALGFGAAVLVLTLIPVVNFVSMPAAVIGATLLWVEQFGKGSTLA